MSLMLNVIMLNVIMLNAIMTIVIAHSLLLKLQMKEKRLYKMAIGIFYPTKNDFKNCNKKENY
jgi:hypothetical protein